MRGVVKMEDCVFCKIIDGKIPSAKVYEDKSIICFLDIMPANKGHCLVVPKKHYETLLDIPEEEIENLMKAVKKVTKALSLSIGSGSYNIIWNNGKVAGQLVNHAHIHIIPRFKGDRLRITWSHKKYAQEEMKETQEKIKKFV
jgi:histidine triad (HIT) family protein